MKLQELRDQYNKVMGEAQAIGAACAADPGGPRSYTPDETAKVNALADQAEKLKADIAEFEAAEKSAAEAAARIQGMGKAPAPTGSSAIFAPETPVAVGEPGWKRDPGFGFRTPRALLLEVIKAAKNPRGIPANLKALAVPMATAGSDEQGTYSDPYGGFMVPETIMPGIMRLEPEGDLLAGRTTVIPARTSTIKINARTDKSHSTSVSGGLRVYRRAEADTVTASRMQTEQIVLDNTALMGIAYATDELLAESPESFAALIGQGFQDEFSSRIMWERINGSGVGEFKGVLTEGTGTRVQVSKETNQTAATFVYENAIKMMARIWKIERAVWMMNRTVLPQLPLFNLTNGGLQSQAVFVTNAAGPVPQSLFGIPIIFTEYCRALGTEGDVLLVNWSEYIESQFKPLEAASSVHVRFVNAESCFRFMLRNAGTCWWRSYLTPKYGDTLSPIVSLETRS